MKRITFNKFSVLLMYVMVIAVPVICVLVKDYPPDALIYCWFGFWAIQAVVTARLRNAKRKHEGDADFWTEAVKYINEDNVESIVEHYTGLDLKRGQRK
jgi:hypothetical protein